MQKSISKNAGGGAFFGMLFIFADLHDRRTYSCEVCFLNIPEPGNRESGETETAIPVKRKP